MLTRLADLIGLIAAGLALLTISTSSMIWPRPQAIASNLAFPAYRLMLGLLAICARRSCRSTMSASLRRGGCDAGGVTRSRNNRWSST